MQSDVAHADGMLEDLDRTGICRLGPLLNPDMVTRSKRALFDAKAREVERLGAERLQKMNEYEVVRDLCTVDAVFVELLANSFLNQFVDAALNDRAIIYSYNAIISESVRASENFLGFNFHRDSQYFNGIRTAIVIMIPLVDTSEINGATAVVPGTHLFAGRPSERFLEQNSSQVFCEAGSAYCCDGTVWHRAGINRSGQKRPLISIEYKLAPFKQQIDFCMSNAANLHTYPEIVRKRLGYDARVCVSSEEYRVEPTERSFKSGNYVMGRTNVFVNQHKNLS
jgi:ectoine hydroxylase-related dioxygenase (phytanoyl-CoA dioxygenase family)